MTYQLLEQIGNGGMATVHRARVHGIGGFDRVIAVKRLLPQFAADPAHVVRFEREAKIATTLSHPNIVQVFDYGGTYIAMEHLEGYSLRELMNDAAERKYQIPLPVILSVLVELCDALDHAHTRTDKDGWPLGIVHRDVSPANVFVRTSGHVKLLDFGVASTHEFPGRLVAGKPSYMAPEVILRGSCTPRVDVFAAGVIAWELLTGRPLFRSTSDQETYSNVLAARFAPPSKLREDCPPELDQVISSALAYEPDQRTKSAQLMREQLRLIITKYLDARPSTVERWLHTRNEPVCDTQMVTKQVFRIEDFTPTPVPKFKAAAYVIPQPLQSDPVVKRPVYRRRRRSPWRAIAIAAGITFVSAAALASLHHAKPTAELARKK